MSTPLLTIITVTKNCGVTIRRTLTSVRALGKIGIEYIVIDGASTDNTLSIVREQNDIVDRLISEPDGGVYSAMNKGIRLAQGRYILFINGDDQLISDGFSQIMGILAHERAQILCATTLVKLSSLSDDILVAKPWYLPFYNSIPHPSSFVERSLLLNNPFREDLRIASDYDFFLKAYLAGKSFLVVPVLTALHYRGGISGDTECSQAEVLKVRYERLGWRYPFYNCLMSTYRYYKRLRYNV